MNRQLYRTNEFAQKSSVSVRTLQFYDKKGLLAPSAYTEAGYRLYSDEDLVQLQQILALKYLGFSLTEIRHLIHHGAHQFRAALAEQKEMLTDKRRQIDAIITAIEKIEGMETDRLDYAALVKIIEAIQVDVTAEWVSNYLSPGEQRVMTELVQQAFSQEAVRKLTTQGDQEFTEAIHQQYLHFYEDVRQLVARNTEPNSPEAQNLMQQLSDLNASQGWDQEMRTGMQQMWDTFNLLPEDKKPRLYALTPDERGFLANARSIWDQTNSHERD